MPTEIEKSKINVEEIYRDEIRKLLKEQKHRSNVVWTFLNSGLGIWFLSTIILGLFTYSYNEYKENRKSNAEKETKIKQLDLEIENRISQFWVHLEPLIKRDYKNVIDSNFALKDEVPYDTINTLWEAFKNPPTFNPRLITTIFKDNEDRSTISLLIELETLLGEKYKLSKNHNTGIDAEQRFSKNELSERREIKNIEKAAVFIAGNGIYYNDLHPSIKVIWKLFAENIITNRWDRVFPYTDCPFC